MLYDLIDASGNTLRSGFKLRPTTPPLEPGQQWVEHAPTQKPPEVPEIVSRFQGRAALMQAGYLDDVEAHGREIFADAFAGKFGAIAEYVPPVVPVVVPQEISKAQGIAIMMDRGIWVTVKTYFEVSATQAEKELFAAVTVFNRASPLLLKVKALFDLDDAFVDQMFIDGAKKVI